MTQVRTKRHAYRIRSCGRAEGCRPQVCLSKKKKVATDETNGEQFLVTVVVDEQFLVTAVVDFYECQYGVVRIG